MTNPYEPPSKPSMSKKQPSVPAVLAKLCLFLAILCVCFIFSKHGEVPPPEDAAKRAGRMAVDIVLPTFFLILAVVFFVVDRRRKRSQ